MQPFKEPPSSPFGELRCPDDGHSLKSNDGPVLVVAACRYCDGLWFTREGIETGEKPLLPDTIKRPRKSMPSPQRRMCPVCRTKLLATQIDDVLIDVCSRCGGVWLGPGGFQAARRRTTRLRVEQITNPQPKPSPRSSRPVNVFEQVVDVIGGWFVDNDRDQPPKSSLGKLLGRLGRRPPRV